MSAIANTATITLPAGVNNGDLLILFAEAYASVSPFTVPSGWIPIYNGADPTATVTGIFYQVYAGSGAPTLNCASATWCLA